MTEDDHIPYTPWPKSNIEAQSIFESFSESIVTRRSMRFYDVSKGVDRETIENIILIASSAPSGANKQPWHFVAVQDPEVKRQIREAAEKEEKVFYKDRAGVQWLKDLEPLATNWQKPFLEEAPWLIVVFRRNYNVDALGVKTKNYYVQESVGIACGFLIASIHMAGLATLTHTPSPMGFLSKILGRPENEKPFLLLPVGHPATDGTVPNIQRKNLDEISHFI